MISKIKKLSLLFVISLVLVGCSTGKSKLPENSNQYDVHSTASQLNE